MFGRLTRPVRTVSSSSRRVPIRTRPGLEMRDVPSSAAASVMLASAFHDYPPTPIMPRMSHVSLSAFHHFPPQPI